MGRLLALRLALLLVLSPFAANPGLAQGTGVQVSGSIGLGLTKLRNQTGAGSLLAVQDSLLSASWLRVSGREDLGSGLEALFRLESSLAPDTGLAGGNGSGGAKFWNRHSWVGLRWASLGQVTLGRQFHAAGDRAVRSFDVYNLAGSSLHVVPASLFGVNRFSGNDARADNSIKYRLAVPGLLEFGLSYALGEGAAARSHSADLALVRKDFEVAASYVRFNAPAGVAATGAVPRHVFASIGGNVTLGPVRAYLAFGESILEPTVAGRQTQKNKLTGLGLNWRVGPWGNLKAAFFGDQARHLNGVPGRDGAKRTWMASAHHDLSPRTELSAAVFRNSFTGGYLLEPINLAVLGRDPAQPGVGGFSLGIRHSF
jgi:predicted porin